LLVASHGRDDVPEPLCAMWTRVVGERAFVLCPRGIDSAVRPETFTFESPEALSAEIEDAVASLRARFPDRVSEGPSVYAGFSLGAFYGVRVVARAPREMPRVVLIEGGHDSWDARTVASFADGGERVLFVSGQRENLERSVRVARELERAGVRTRIEHAESAGHVYVGEVEARLRDAFAWVVEGDPRWS
jgi:predicted esterase